MRGSLPLSVAVAWVGASCCSRPSFYVAGETGRTSLRLGNRSDPASRTETTEQPDFYRVEPQVREYFLEAVETEIGFGNGGVVQTMITYNIF